MKITKVLELYNGRYSYFVSSNGYNVYSDLRDLIDELRRPHTEYYELHSFALENYDSNEELSQFTEEEMNKYFWGIINKDIPEDEQIKAFELFWRNSDEYWC